LKLSKLRVVAFAQFAKKVKRLLWLCGYLVPKTHFSQRNLFYLISATVLFDRCGILNLNKFYCSTHQQKNTR